MEKLFSFQGIFITYLKHQYKLTTNKSKNATLEFKTTLFIPT